MAYQMMVSGNGSGVSPGWRMGYVPYGSDDTIYTKLFVGGLAWETKSEALHRYFKQFGMILEAVVIADKHTGRSKGYGFVTFRDPEAAKKACANPNPVIGGRRANCNLASLGRAQYLSSYGHLRPRMPYMIRSHVTRSPYIGNPVYQLPFGYGYQPAFQYPPFRFPPYGPDYIYPQVYTMPSTVSTNKMPYGQAALPPSSTGYATSQGYLMENPNILSYTQLVLGKPISETFPATRMSYYSGIAVASPGQPHLVTPTDPGHFMQSTVSKQMAS